MAKKIAEIRIKGKVRIVQIKMNQGPNHTLKGEEAVRFEQKRNAYLCDNNSHSEASLLAATDFIEGRL